MESLTEDGDAAGSLICLRPWTIYPASGNFASVDEEEIVAQTSPLQAEPAIALRCSLGDRRVKARRHRPGGMFAPSRLGGRPWSD
jgi:hypothetical protein